jgi:hypothetical protein
VELCPEFCREMEFCAIPADSPGDELACPVTRFDVEVAA